MSTFFAAISIVLVLNAFLCLYRAFIGPTVTDRILAINIVGVKTLVALVLIAFFFQDMTYVDVALAYALLNFVVTITATRYLETGAIKGDWESD